MNQWFVAYTHARAEGTALRHLRQQGFGAYLPQYLKRRRHARRVDWVPWPLFPRYVFVAMDLDKSRWRAVRSTIGVSDLVCQGDRPAPVPPEIVAEIRAREDDRGLVRIDPRTRFKKGDPVQIEAGPFSNVVGLFESVTDQERVIVLLNLLGRQVRASLPPEAVCAGG
jgi:transcriptional antiterminator RfaH